MIQINPMTVSLITGSILPVLLGLMLKYSQSEKVKMVTSILVNALAALIINAVNDQGIAVLSWNMLGLFLVQFVTATTTYLGIFKNLNINYKLPTPLPMGSLVAKVTRSK